MLDRPPVAGADRDSPERCNPADRLSACRLAFLAQPPSRRLGCLQIVDLSRLRQRLGKRWPDLRGRVADVVDATLARSLGPGDLSLEVGEDCRYVLRIGVERRDLERHGELLAAEATARLCGTIPGGAAIRVSTMGLDLDAGLDGVNSAETLRTRVAAIGLAPGHDRTDAVGNQLELLQPRFRPILNLRKHLVSAYQLAFDRDLPGSDDCGQAQLDEWSLKQAALVVRGSPGRRAPGLVVDVSYPTLATMRWREPFMQQCRRLPRQSAGRLIFQVHDLPPGLPQARVRELMAYLRPFCLVIAVRLPATAADVAHLAASGIGGVSVAEGSLPTDERGLAMALTTLAGSARAIGLRSGLAEASSARICRAALAAGIDHLSGDEMMPTLAQPGRALRISR